MELDDESSWLNNIPDLDDLIPTPSSEECHDRFDFDQNCFSDSYEETSPGSINHQHSSTLSNASASYDQKNLQQHFDQEQRYGSGSGNDSPHSGSQSSCSQVHQNHTKKSKNDKMMSEEEWQNSIDIAIDLLKHTYPTEVHLDAFTVEKTHRYSVKLSYLTLFRIFPWFYASKSSGKFRQTLKVDAAQGPSIEIVIESLNFFLKRAGSFTSDDYQFLEDYYRNKMEIPVASHCLTAIVEVAMAFRRALENNSPNGTSFSSASVLLIPSPSSSLIFSRNRYLQ
jgi:hypothetical protein